MQEVALRWGCSKNPEPREDCAAPHAISRPLGCCGFVSLGKSLDPSRSQQEMAGIP